MASEYLTEITNLLQPEVPIAEEVTDKLIQFADAVSEGGPAERDIVLGLDAYAIVCKAWTLCCSSGIRNVTAPSPGATQCRDAVLRALYTITAGNPEIIDEIGWEIITLAIDKAGASEETHILALRVIRNVSIKSEENRETFTWTLGLMDPLTSLIVKDKPTSAFIQEWCATMKALVLSDDPREVYNRAPERKRVIHRSIVLRAVAEFTNQPEYEKDAGTLNAIVVFLGTMAVNEDVCLLIESGNILPGLYSILKMHFANKTLFRNTVSLLRYLCVDQTVREKCSAFAFMKYLLDNLPIYNGDADVVDVLMSCFSMMTLRNACQTSQFVTRNGLNMLLQIASDFKDDVTILKGVCFTLRNVCENGGPEVRDKILQEGFIAILNDLLASLPELKDYYLIPVLRELGQGDSEPESTEGAAESSMKSQDPELTGNEDTEAYHPDEEVPDGFGEALEENF